MSSQRAPLPSVPEWKAAIRPFAVASDRRALWQLANTLGPLALCWLAIGLLAPVSLWLALPVAALAGGFMVRTFILFHDCGHGSFFRSRRANDLTGILTGLICITPYHHWRWEHAQHHATAGDLDRRELGDVWTMTVDEFAAAPPWKRAAYRFARHPLVLFGLAPLYLFGIQQRLPSSKASRAVKRSVWWTNLALLAQAALFSLWLGLGPYLLLQTVAIAVAGAAGVGLFYVQHQFPGVYWGRGRDWDYTAAALYGSSFYDLPMVLRWFSGNIGFHHLHHLSPRIPNYHLERCHRGSGLSDGVKPLGLRESFGTLRLHLWDEAAQRLVSFRDARRMASGA